ncbi:MAG: hypothetical protein M3Z96_01410 [Pseudomonadota bacterium]|nr:hypothetical protein [Pseudomonadota bacterium]
MSDTEYPSAILALASHGSKATTFNTYAGLPSLSAESSKRTPLTVLCRQRNEIRTLSYGSQAGSGIALGKYTAGMAASRVYM